MRISKEQLLTSKIKVRESQLRVANQRVERALAELAIAQKIQARVQQDLEELKK